MVMGPAGTGKSTYCRVIQEWAVANKRHVHVVNLDPAAESFGYDVAFDVRQLISLDDVMEELELGPNGGLVYCMEYLLENLGWLKDELGSYGEEDYIIFDCPGQVELYSHMPVMRRILLCLQEWGLTVAGVFLLDATFMADAAKFISGSLLSLSAMVQLEIPHLNVLSKCDLADQTDVERFLEVDASSMVALQRHSPLGCDGIPRLQRLTGAISEVVDEYAMVGFIPLDISDSDSVSLVMAHLDNMIQWDETQEPKQPPDLEVDVP
jgi:GTPase SAR1 family protein